ncbi:MAG: hypothetical protein FJ191_00360 [Gammaproteobacteria bacterium]|nr:hypothetical protein [Gammaproteobacteria bacterium]
MAQISRLQATAYLARWRQVREQEVAALRASPIAHKFRQLCALAASRDVFPVDPERAVQAAEVAARWHRIRTYYDG